MSNLTSATTKIPGDAQLMKLVKSSHHCVACSFYWKNNWWSSFSLVSVTFFRKSFANNFASKLILFNFHILCNIWYFHCSRLYLEKLSGWGFQSLRRDIRKKKYSGLSSAGTLWIWWMVPPSSPPTRVSSVRLMSE